MDKNPKTQDALGRLFTARCIIEMIVEDDVSPEIKERLDTARDMLVSIHKDLSNA